MGAHLDIQSVYTQFGIAVDRGGQKNTKTDLTDLTWTDLAEIIG